MKLDILVLAAHPDDAELSCSGTLLSAIAEGKKVGIVDLTKGELGTRGTPEIRQQESDAATKLLGIHVRENLGFRDGFFVNDEAHQMEVIKMIRKYQPDVLLGNAIYDRHVDHIKGGALANDAAFLSGLRKIETELDGQLQAAWRPGRVYHYIQDQYVEPDFVLDITPFFETKMEAIKAFKSQFFDPNSLEPASYISRPDYLDFVEARGREWGHKINVKYGEGFTTYRKIGVKSFDSLI